MPDFVFAGFPWADLGIGCLVSLGIAALGFRRIDYFVSLGYAFSIAAEAVLFATLYRDALSAWGIVQVLLLLAYGMRLGLYLVARERSPAFARELAASKERGRHIAGGVKFVIWAAVALLYAAMFSPGLFSLVAARQGTDLWSLPIGCAVMVAGLALETIADAQKARFKAAHPSRFVRKGLFAIVRCPNYFGEMVFWLGAFVSGIAAYRSLAAWLVAGAGCLCIQLIMLGSARRLESKQAERYGDDPAYRAYVAAVPILVPFLPVYSLRNWRIYLG